MTSGPELAQKQCVAFFRPEIEGARSKLTAGGDRSPKNRGDTLSTTTTRIVTSLIAAMAVTAAACSTPESQQAAATPAQTPAQAQPAQTGPPAQSTQPAQSAPAAQGAASGAAQPSESKEVPPPVPPAPPKPKVALLKAGQVLTIRTTRLLSTKTMKTGDAFSAILEEPITVAEWEVAGAGAKVDGRIVEADKGGRVKGKASLTIELTALTTSDGQRVDIVTSVVGSEAAANKGKDAAKVGVGAGAGAAVGAIAGGGKGAAIGAIIGGGAGAASRGDAAEIPAESVVSFELRSPIRIEQRRK